MPNLVLVWCRFADARRRRCSAWGDANNDYKTDAITLVGAGQNSSIEVRLFDRSTFQFKVHEPLTLRSVGDVKSVVPADFNVDGHLDLLVLLKRAKSDNELYDVHVYLQDGDKQAFGKPHVLSEPVGSHVTVLDANFDMRPDLLALYRVDNSSAPKTAVWYNVGPRSVTGGDDGGAEPTFDGFALKPLDRARALSRSHSPLFADVTGDCGADLLLPTNEGVGGSEAAGNAKSSCAAPNVCYQLFEPLNGTLVASANASVLHLADAFDATLADVNADGSLDLVYPSQTFGTDQASLVVLYNAHLGDTGAASLCQAHSVPFFDCAVPTKHAALDKSAPAPSSSSSSSASSACRSTSTLEHAFALPLPTDPIDVVATVRIGDADRDGYPDALVALEKEGTRFALLLNNSQLAAAAGGAPELREFVPVTSKGVAPLASATNILSASFADLGNKGSLDVLLNHASTTNASSSTLFNNMPRAHYFVSVMGTNGICRAWCDEPSPRFVTPEPVGASLAGSTFRIGHAAYNGDRRRRTASPLVRSAFGSLELPYEIVGLGIADNQLDQFVFSPPFYADGVGTATAQRNFEEGVFPRATVIAWPTPLDKPALWSLEQQLRFGGATFWTAITTASTTAVLAVVIAYYVYKEKVEDEVDRRRSAQIFSVF